MIFFFLIFTFVSRWKLICNVIKDRSSIMSGIKCTSGYFVVLAKISISSGIYLKIM